MTSITRPATSASGTSVQHTSYFAYDYSSGRLTSSKDENSVSTAYSYNDQLGRITQLAPTGGSSISISYNDSGNSPNVTVTRQIDAVKSITTSSYSDGLGHIVKQDTTDPSSSNNSVVSLYRTYDGLGRVMQQSNPVWGEPSSGDKVSYGYDGMGRQVIASQQDGTTISQSYLGSQTTVRDGRGITTTRRVNAFGDLVFVQEASLSGQSVGTDTAYAYDAMGNLISVSQDTASSSPLLRSYVYDALGRLSSSTNPENGTTIYKYVNVSGKGCSGVASLVCQRSNGNGVITFAYDALNRVTAKQMSGPISSKFYGPSSCYLYDSYGGSSPTNAVGRMTAEWTQRASCTVGAATVPSGALSRKIIDGYDAMGHVTSQRTCTLTSCTREHPQAFSYDLAGNLIGFDDGRSGGRTFSLGYDSAGRFNLLQTPVPGSSNPLSLYQVNEFDPFGPSKAVVGGVMTWKNTYDVRGRMTSGSAIQGLQ